MLALVAQDMALYVPPDKPWVLRLRSTEAFQERLERVAELWAAHAKARGDDAKVIDVSYVVRRLLESGIAQAFDEYGGFPKDDETFEKQLELVAKAAKQSKR